MPKNNSRHVIVIPLLNKEEAYGRPTTASPWVKILEIGEKTQPKKRLDQFDVVTIMNLPYTYKCASSSMSIKKRSSRQSPTNYYKSPFTKCPTKQIARIGGSSIERIINNVGI